MRMRILGHRIVVLLGIMLMLAGCGTSPRPSPRGEGGNSPAAARHPLMEGEACRTLVGIDSLMWVEADSALKVMLEFAGSEEADSMGVFEGHYCQVLVAELLFKNYYAQSNRTELMAAMDYFDSLTAASDQNPNIVFLDARAHYMNGVGYYEHDSLPEACAEYLRALRIMENHFTENKLVGRKASFMSLIYNRLMDLFSFRLMQETAIYCGQQSLHYDEIEPPTATNRGGVLYFIGKQYQKLNENDSAAYYYEMALEALPDSSSPYYRDIVAAWALLDFDMGHGAQNALDSLKSILSHAVDENERMSRYIALGAIYKLEGQYDSAKYYLEPVFEKDPKRAAAAAPYLHDLALNEGDSAKANQYAQFLVKEAADSGDKQARVSKLNDMFQSYLREKQEAASMRARKEDVKKAVRIIVPLTILMALAIIVFAKLRSRKLLKEQQAVAQKELDDRDRQHKETVKKQQEEAIQQARMMLPQRVNDLYHSKVSNRMERILEEFEAAYPYALERLAAAYPDLNKTEANLVVLSFLQFRAKEEADLLGLSENTVMQYRSNLRKKTANASFSEFFS